MKILKFQSILVSLLIIVLSINSFAADEAIGNGEHRWPKEINNAGGNLTVYQPQLESMEKNSVSARAAVSVKLPGEKEPVFGAIWITSRLSTDRGTRMATLEDIKVERIKFPDEYKDKSKSLASVIEQGLLKKDIKISLDRLNAMLEFAKKEEEASRDFIMKPPEIIFSTNPAVLVSIDGEPKLQPVEGKKLMRVINAAYTILLDTETKKYYLGSGENWVSASDILGDWTPTTEIPDDVKNFDDGEKESAENMVTSGGVLPKVIVTTKAAELIVIEGAPEFVPIRGTELLYIDNTEADIFMEIGSQKIYLLLSGRWYSASKKKGPWKYVPSDKLPAGFAKISPGSSKGQVLTQISGTEEAQDAILDSYIPQTAEISRDDTNLVVAFDGEPEFEDIEGTEMEYAVNSEDQVVYVDNKYYCCKNGIWYVADKLVTTAEKTTENVAEVAGGAVEGVLKSAGNITRAALNLTLGTAWRICSLVPPVIYTIPPSCPVYPVTYCRVYGYTPEVVYVGYTPGYIGSYRYGGCVVYGTGYRYTPWLGRYYWPRPCTFGLSVRYYGVAGWHVGVGYGAVYGGLAVARTAGAVAWHRNRGYGSGYYGRGGNNNLYVNNSRTYKNERNINNRPGDRQRPGTGDRQRPGTGDRQRPGTGDRALPSTGDRKLPSTGDRALPSTGDRALPSTGDRKLPSTGDRALPSTGDRKLPSTGDRALPSTGDRKLPSTGDRALPSTGDRKLPSTGDRALPSTGDRKLPSTGDRALPSTGNRALPSQGRSSGSLQDISSKRNNVYADKNGNVSRKNLDGWQTKNKSGWSNSRQSPQTRSNMDNQHKARQRGTTNTSRNRSQTRPSNTRSSSSRQTQPSRSSSSRSRSSGGRSGGRSGGSRGGGGRGGGGRR